VNSKAERGDIYTSQKDQATRKTCAKKQSWSNYDATVKLAPNL